MNASDEDSRRLTQTAPPYFSVRYGILTGMGRNTQIERLNRIRYLHRGFDITLWLNLTPAGRTRVDQAGGHREDPCSF